MFAERLAGARVARIARGLNDDGVPCPAVVDAERNAHRGQRSWTLRTVACILANPRYTGRQVWNRYGTDHQHPSAVRRPNPAAEWSISARDGFERLVVAMDAADEEARAGAPSERLIAVEQAYCRFALENRGYFRIMFKDGPAGFDLWGRFAAKSAESAGEVVVAECR